MAGKNPDGTWKRGTSNTNSRGSAKQRARRKQWLLDTFGNGVEAKCSHCPAVLNFSTINVDRKIPGWQGGTYRRANIQPSCGDCGSKQGGQMSQESRALKKLERSTA